MATKAPAEVNYAGSEELIKKLYDGIDELKDVITIDNERNRVSFCINMYLTKEISTLYDAICQAKPTLATMDYKALEEIVSKKLKEKGIN